MPERPRSTGEDHVQGQRDFDALRERRMRAAEMFDHSKRQIDVVVELGVSAQTASRWYQAWQAGGRQALAGAGRAGRQCKLSDDQVDHVAETLARGPMANGFPTDRWTLTRVAEVIEKVTGVRYSQTQTWTILRERLGWSRQRPPRGGDRAGDAVEVWARKESPRSKKKHKPGEA